jgi:hypothetical protein
MKNVNHNPQHTQIISRKTKTFTSHKRRLLLSCSTKEHNEFTMMMAKAQMQKPILKFRTPKP